MRDAIGWTASGASLLVGMATLARARDRQIDRLGLATLGVAEGDVGIGEACPNWGPEIRQWLARFGVTVPAPYCAAALSDWIARASLRTHIKPPIDLTAEARTMAEEFGRVGRLVLPSEGPLTLASAVRPRPGWVVFFDHATPENPRAAHTGIVEIAADSSGDFGTVEANTVTEEGQGVRRRTRSIAQPDLMGYGVLSGNVAPEIELPAVQGLERTSAAFRRKLVQIASELDLDAGCLAAVIAFETGGTFRADIENRAGSGAVGLIQFLPASARSLGTTTAELARMTALEQLDYVRAWFARTDRKIETCTDHYLAVFAPSFIGRPDDAVIFESPSDAYRKNAGLDLNRDGAITVGEVSAAFHAVLQEADTREPVTVTAAPDAARAIGTALVIAGVGGLAFEAWRSRHG